MGLRERTLGFIEGSRSAASTNDLLDGVMAFCRDLDIEGVFVADVPDPGEKIDAHILLRGWNQDWIDRYVAKSYVHLDPVARDLKKRVGPYLWSESCSRTLEREEKTVMGEASEHGLVEGLSVPIFDLDGRQSCVSFAGRKLRLNNEARSALQMVAIFSHSRLREMRRCKNVRLSARERECLAWASIGKSCWETGRILDLSEETTKKYLLSATRKLGVRSKVHAVASALRSGIIS